MASRGLALVAVLLLAGAHGAVFAAGPVFQRLGTEEGLPDNRISTIIRDPAGHVWIGTEGGLVRHQAHGLEVLRHDPDDPDSLPGNNILSAMAHSDGSVWAAISGQGLVQLRATRVVRHLRLAADDGPLRDDLIWSLAEDCDGRVWLGFARGGLARLDPQDGTLVHHEAGDAGLPAAGFQLQLHVDSRCRLWSLRTNGAWRTADVVAPQFRRIIDPADHGLDNLLNMHQTGADRFVVGGRAGVLFVEGDVVRSVQRLDLGPTTIAEAGNGELWLGMPESLIRLDADGRVADRLRYRRRVPDGVPEGQVTALHRGPEDELWLGTHGGGVGLLPPGWRGFRRFEAGIDDEGLQLDRVTAVARDPDSGGLWLGSRDHGLQYLDPVTGQGPVVPLRPDRSGPEKSILGLAVAGPELLLAQQDALYAVDRSTHAVRRVSLDPRIPEGNLRMLVPAGEGEFWLGILDAGLFRIRADGRITARFHPGGEGAYRLEEPDPRVMAPGDAGEWWLLGHRQVYYHENNGGFRALDRAGDLKPQAVARVGDTLWLAQDSLLEAWRRDASGGWRVTRRYTARDGLPAGTVADILPGADGRIWLTMSTGLVRLDPQRERFRVFSRAAGLPTSEFLPGAGQVMPDGRLAAGTTRGLVIVDPRAIATAAPARPPPVHITGLRAGNEWLQPPEQGRLELPHDRNALEFRFVALSYLDPARNQYRVRLDGWESEWFAQVGAGTRFYPRLPPGDYRFRVQAASAAGAWNETGDVLAVRIRRPPWNAPPAWAAYGLLAIAAGALGWRGLRRSRQRRQDLRRVREQRALAEEQQRFLAALGSSLEPLDLGRVVAAELRRVTGADRCWLGYLQDEFPRALLGAGGDPDVPDRRAWREQLRAGNTGTRMTVEIIHEGRQLAAAVLERQGTPFGPGARARADLVLQTAGQAMENARLMQNVRSLARQAEQASTAKSDFLATMSHEIRTPLHGLLGMVELLEGTTLAPEQREMLATVNLSGRQLQRILNDVLDLSRIEAGRIELEPRPFELVTLLEQVVDLHAPVAARKGLDMRLKMAADTPVLAGGDPDRLAQVLGNLINNAVKFTERGGVELDCRIAGDRLVLAVADSGPGIDPALRAELFEPFTQLDASATRRHSGSGLGLAICRRLVQAMGGSIALAEASGRGSRFVVSLPTTARPLEIPRSTAVLDRFVLGTALPAPAERVVLRLSRRWGLERVRLGADHLPDGLDAILAGADRPLPDALADAGVPVLMLGLPGMASAALPERARILRWPLTESRLIAALLDLRFARIAAGSGD